MPADTMIARGKAPLLMLYTLDDFEWHRQLKAGGAYSLAFRDLMRDHPHVTTLVLDRGNHGGSSTCRIPTGSASES